MRRTFITSMAAGLGSMALTRGLSAQSAAYPSKPIRFIVGLGPGSGADTATRFIAERIGRTAGQTAVVENRPGGDGFIAVQNLLSAPPDGHAVLYLSPSPMVLTPLLRNDLPYDPIRDIRPVAYMSRGYAVMVTGGNSPHKTFNDVISLARAKPNTVKMSNYGHHYRIGALSLQKLTGADFIHVAYKGAGQANNDVIAGDIDVALTDVGGAMPLIESGRLRALAMTSPGRHKFLPNVPSVKELGIPYELMVWTGYGVHSKTPEASARKIEEILLQIIRSKEYAEYNEKQSGGEVVGGTGDQLKAHVIAETNRYRELGKSMNLGEQ